MSQKELVGKNSSGLDTLEQWELDRKVHVSPLEAFKSRDSTSTWFASNFDSNTWFNDIFPVMEFEGTLSQVVDELQLALANPLAGTNFIKIAFYPARIIRGVVDYRIDNPDSALGDKYIEEALKIGLSICRGDRSAGAFLRDFKNSLTGEGNEALLHQSVKQEADFSTWRATDPDKSFSTAQRLKHQVKNSDILFIALGHGAVVAGMDVFLYYCGITRSSDSQFYVTRFSRSKHQDLCPRFSEGELELLRAKAKGRQIVVFDEDIATGKTLEIAASVFADILSPLFYPIIVAENTNTKYVKGKELPDKQFNKMNKGWIGGEKNNKVEEQIIFYSQNNFKHSQIF